MSKLLVIGGPTASGKTELAIEFALRLNGEIVTADSMQVYKHLNIGTAKPDRRQLELVPHHMLDVVEPWEDYTVYDYVQQASQVIEGIIATGKTPIVCGGTGLYINSLLDGVCFVPMKCDSRFRTQMQEFSRHQGNMALYNLLKEKDPVVAGRLHHNDVKRVIRALEVIEFTGKSMVWHEENSRSKGKNFKFAFLGLDFLREVLYNRIDLRAEGMIESGLVEEVRGILSKFPRTCNGLRGIGYKETVWYLDGLVTQEEMTNVLKRNTRRLAKRQLTWFRKNPGIHWLDMNRSREEIISEGIKIWGKE